ncbi:MAG: autotransporter-associated beta strand repeat-containing protein [Verrucomicrobiae bacterium]
MHQELNRQSKPNHERQSIKSKRNQPFGLSSRFNALLALASAMMVADVSLAQTDVTWHNASAHAWGSAFNWNPIAIPDTPVENAVFSTVGCNLSSSYKINGTSYLLAAIGLSANYSVGQLKFANAPTGTNGWRLYESSTSKQYTLTVSGNNLSNPVIMQAATCPAAMISWAGIHDLNLALGLNGANEIQVNGAALVIQTPIINGSGITAGLTKTGSGLLQLSGPNSYTGTTTISAGTLQLTGGGSINTSPTLSIAAGATFDVSALSTYTLNGGSALSASGIGTTVGVNAAAITGGTTVDLGTQPITLNYDGSNPALYISQGALSLSGNLFTVNTAAPLAAGTYTLIQQASGDIVTAGNSTVTGTAIGPAQTGNISVTGGRVLLTISDVAATQVRIETAADGTGTVVPAQILPAGSGLTVYAIARAADNSFVANVAASWSLTNLTGGTVTGDLISAGDGKSATFTGHIPGTAVIHAAARAWPVTNSGTLTVVLGPAAQVRVETAADGSGTVVPAQTLVPGQAVSVYAITRDAAGNFLANAAADTWTIENVTGYLMSSDLSPGSGPSSTFTGHGVGAGQIRASISGLTSVDSGVIGVAMSWSATPDPAYQWDTYSANWTGGAGVYADGSPVQFTDAGSASSPIVLVGDLSPLSVTVDVATNHYIFSGDGDLTGSCGLLKRGSGTLTLANNIPNTYTGATVVNSGTLEVTSNTWAAVNASPITIASNATLSMLGHAYSLHCYNNVSGAGLWQVATGAGSDTTHLDGDYRAFNGTLEVVTGNAKIDFTTTRYPSASATLRLDRNLTAYIPYVNAYDIFPCAIQMYGVDNNGGLWGTGEQRGQLRINAPAASGPITLFGDSAIAVDSGRATTLSGNIVGNFGFTKLSDGKLTLSAANTYTGNTEIWQGTLALASGGSISNSSNIILNARASNNDNATFDVSAAGFTVAAGHTLQGNGLVIGALTNNGTLAPGPDLDTLVFANAPTLNSGGTVSLKLNKDLGGNDQIAVNSGTLVFGGTLAVTNYGPADLQVGDTFQLFSANTLPTSNFTRIVGSPGPELAYSFNPTNGTITVVSSTQSPVANPDVVTTPWSATVIISPLTNDSDPNGYPLSLVNLSPASGTAQISNATNVLFTPAWGIATNVTIGYTLTNGHGGTASSQITVTVTTPRAPVITSVVRSGPNLVFSGTGGAPNGGYVVLASTNLALARTNWVPVSTGAFDTSGNFRVTNAIIPAIPREFFLIELVSAVQPSQPVITSVVRSGPNLVFSGTGGAPNGGYVVLASTNLALARTNWVPVWTNAFDAGGNFRVTNTIIPATPQEFFLIRQ